MSYKVQQSVCSDCLTYAKSRIKFNTFNTFNNVQDVKITFRVRVSDDESRVIITEPTMTDSISFSVFTGIIRKLADFQEEWNEEHKLENKEQ